MLPNFMSELNKLMKVVILVLNSKPNFPKTTYGNRNTNDFYFFHTKKWVYRLISNILKKLTNYSFVNRKLKSNKNKSEGISLKNKSIS